MQSAAAPRAIARSRWSRMCSMAGILRRPSRGRYARSGLARSLNRSLTLPSRVETRCRPSEVLSCLMNNMLRLAPQAFVLALTAAIPCAAQRSSFMTTLGKDTLSFEQYERTGDQIVGDWVTLYGGIMVHHYDIQLGPDGAVRRYQLTLHRLSGAVNG